MSLTYDQMLHVAAARKAEPTPYGGEVFAREAWDYMQQHPAYVIDVRTVPEWKFTGVVALEESKGELLTISWVNYPDFSANPDFFPQMRHAIKQADAVLFFLCKTGGRSYQAANKIAELGYHACFNITHGYEGDHNEAGQRGRVNGWKAEGLPWKQP